MAGNIKAQTNLTPLPMLPQESLYIGVDIGKFRHVAGFLSRTLLVRHERFEGCPTFAFEQSREGFRSLVDHIRSYVPLEQAVVLLEHTGHYHRLLEQYLLELDITVYRIHVQKRAEGMLKTDKRDALGRFLDKLSVPACLVRGMSGNNSFNAKEFEHSSGRKPCSKQASTLNLTKNPKDWP